MKIRFEEKGDRWDERSKERIRHLIKEALPDLKDFPTKDLLLIVRICRKHRYYQGRYFHRYPTRRMEIYPTRNTTPKSLTRTIKHEFGHYLQGIAPAYRGLGRRGGAFSEREAREYAKETEV